MDVGKTDRSGSVPRRKRTNPPESHLRSPLLPSEKNNGGSPAASPSCARKLRPREIVSKYKSGNTSLTSSLSKSSATQQKQPRSSSPATLRRNSGVESSQLPKRSLSAERRQPSSSFSRSSSSRPSTPSNPSRPSTPLNPSRPSTPSNPSRPSTPSNPSRPSTPARDSVAEGHGGSSSRRSAGVRTMMDSLWPSTRSLTTSSNTGSKQTTTCKKEKPVTSLDQALKSPSESKRTPLRRRNASNPDQSGNSKLIRNSDKQGSSSYHHNNRISMMSSRLSSPTAMTRSLDLTDKKTKSRTRTSSPSNPLRPKSPAVRISNNSPPCKPLPRSISDDGKLSTLSRASLRPQSPPCKLPFPSSSSRPATASPSKPRPSTPSPFSSSSVRSYIVDASRKGKKNSNNIDNIHQLRLLYNQYLQWRIINARTEAAMSIKKITAESVIYSVWMGSSELLVKVITKKIKLQQIRREFKLHFVLKQQLAYLEEWAALDKEHGGLLLRAAEALKASIIHLPLTGRAKADVLSVKDAFGSALNVTQFLGSSIYGLRSMVEDTNSLVSELASVATKESYLLDECTELLASTAAMQVQELSLRAHLVQLKQGMLMDSC